MTSIGLVGYGRWGKHIFRDLRALGADVHVAVPSAASRAEALAKGAASVCSDCSLLPQVDGFVVATPTMTHASVLSELTSRERPIFVEKPMSDDLEQAQALVKAAGERIFVMDKWRYHPGVEALAARAKSGALGDILGIRTFRLGWDNPHKDVDAIWILLPHDLSIAYEILGYLPPARSAIATVPGQGHSNLIAVLSGPTETCQVTMEISAHHPVSRRSVIVVGSKASAQLADSYDDRIFIAEGVPGINASTPTHEHVASEFPLLRELRAFLEYIQGGAAPRSSASEGLLFVERVAALRRLAGV
ncbi:Gfo/Idh/MocA family protein [Ensifer sp. ENS03]|uniref:Gfo/Idh/MocA family protein n=1 Tax=Ensifer sp. ENS03 TaxID=2769283 RepID=UPI00177F215E|nr:Gfo/Idh/MocA family oxidoreductase [Ensifer sp. ENS03]MBD9559549.1 Gfo/Idh/MocA family oxidoreductase [Ensifer sp. ENS03]